MLRKTVEDMKPPTPAAMKSDIMIRPRLLSMNLMPTMSPTDSGGAYWKIVLIESGLTRPNPKHATETTSRKDAKCGRQKKGDPVAGNVVGQRLLQSSKEDVKPKRGRLHRRKTSPQVPSTRMPYGLKDGSSESPVRNTSTARAQRLPSLIARTTSDWPLRVSPQAKTPGTDVA